MALPSAPHSPCHQLGLAVSRKGAPSSPWHPEADLQGARKPPRVLLGGPCPQSSRKARPQGVASGSDTERVLPCSLQLGVQMAHQLPSHDPAGAREAHTRLVPTKTESPQVDNGSFRNTSEGPPSVAHLGAGCPHAATK